jgi:translation initiation factor IF-2
MCQISALAGDNVDELLETVMLVAEVFAYLHCPSGYST